MNFIRHYGSQKQTHTSTHANIHRE